MNSDNEQLKSLMERYPDSFDREVMVPHGRWFHINADDYGWFSQFVYRLIPKGPLHHDNENNEKLFNRAIYLGMGPLELPDHIGRFSGFLLDDEDIFCDISVDKTDMKLSGQIRNCHYWIDVNDPNADDILEYLGHTVNLREEEFDLGEAANTVISMRTVTEEEQQLQLKLDTVCRHRDELEKNRDLQVELNEELREQNESLQEELEEALNHISDLEDDNADIDAKLGEVQNEVEELEGRCDDLEDENANLQDYRDDLEDENANLQDYLEESESRIAELEELVHNQTSTLKQKGWIDPVEAMIISRKIDNLYNTINRL